MKYLINSVMYHYIRKNTDIFSKNLNYLKIDEFVKQIKFFKKNYDLLSHNDFCEVIKNKKKIKRNIMLLTFDDGYLDHYKYVYPILKENKISGNFYVPSKILLKNYILDVNKIHLILAKVHNKKMLLDEIFNICKKKYNFSLTVVDIKKLNTESRFDNKNTIIIKRLLQYYLPKKIRIKINDYLFKKFVDVNYNEVHKNMYLNLNHINEMSKNGLFFGSPGHDHEWMEFLDKKSQKIEIENSLKFLKKIEKKTDKFSICYPYGSYNSQTLKIVKKQKFSFGFTSKYGGVNLVNNSNNFTIPRYDANDFKILR